MLNLYQQLFIQNKCFSSEILQFWYMPDRDCLHEQPSVKTLRSETLMSFPKQKHHMCVAAFSLLRDPMWGEEDKKA